MSREIERITTADGSHSLYRPDLRETYHSTHGALQESRYVFLRHGLEHKAEETNEPLTVFEVGLGTGLNVLLSAILAEESGRQVQMVSIEAYPVEKEIWTTLNYAEQTGHPRAAEWWDAIHRSDWGAVTRINTHFSLIKIHGRLEDYAAPEGRFDVIYYDAFAPGKQAEMWALPMLQKVANAMKVSGYLVTYCAQGQFRRDLKTAGLEVESLAGPPGKKEMTRARKPLS